MAPHSLPLTMLGVGLLCVHAGTASRGSAVVGVNSVHCGGRVWPAWP